MALRQCDRQSWKGSQDATGEAKKSRGATVCGSWSKGASRYTTGEQMAKPAVRKTRKTESALNSLVGLV